MNEPSTRIFNRPPVLLDLLLLAGVVGSICFAPPLVNRFVLLLGFVLFWAVGCVVHAVLNWRDYLQAGKKGCFKRVIITTTVLSGLGLLFVIDNLLAASTLAETAENERSIGNNQKGYELHTFVLYPYSALHIQPNCQVKGSMPLEANPYYDTFDVRSGDHGFFVDFDLDSPPAKLDNEFRIVLTGGSAAQGYGGQTNDHMFYKLLESRLAAACQERGLHLRVINLAMAGSISYQNFIMLNRWGHALEPDLILSFSGVNDVEVATETACDMPFRYADIWGLTQSTWVTENRGLLKDVLELYPSVNASLIGLSLRIFRSRSLADEAKLNYWQRFQYPGSDGSNDPASVAVDLYVHALKSIKRDFGGIPMVVVFQPYRQASGGNKIAYEFLFDRYKPELEHYLNDQWYFLNLHEFFEEHEHFKDETIFDGVHFLNQGHDIVAEYLTTELLPVIQQLDRG